MPSTLHILGSFYMLSHLMKSLTLDYGVWLCATLYQNKCHGFQFDFDCSDNRFPSFKLPFFNYNIVLCITLCVCSVFRKYLDLFSFSALYCIIDIILTGFNKNFGYQYTHNNPQWQWFLLGWTQIYIWIITQIQIFILKNTDAFCGYRLQHILINTLEGIWNPVSNLALTARWLSY